jgi:phosphoglycolate phosphatase-like HAD superfamily hydrolase
MPKLQLIVLFDVSDTLFDTATETLLPGARELVEALRSEDVHLGIASGLDDRWIDELLAKSGLEGAFPVVVGCRQSQLDMRRYEIALEMFGRLLPKGDIVQEVFVMDDRMSRMEAANALGFKFLAVATGGTSPAAFQTGLSRPYHVFDDLSDTRAIVAAITGRDTARRGRPKSLSKL